MGWTNEYGDWRRRCSGSLINSHRMELEIRIRRKSKIPNRLLVLEHPHLTLPELHSRLIVFRVWGCLLRRGILILLGRFRRLLMMGLRGRGRGRGVRRVLMGLALLSRMKGRGLLRLRRRGCSCLLQVFRRRLGRLHFVRFCFLPNPLLISRVRHNHKVS